MIELALLRKRRGNRHHNSYWRVQEAILEVCTPTNKCVPSYSCLRVFGPIFTNHKPPGTDLLPACNKELHSKVSGT
ncbi:hypothetical protein QQP08_011749 [Theobroma cacao]|nr:hypothetical protein QQP08_011749 [Theobroma cacao]